MTTLSHPAAETSAVDAVTPGLPALAWRAFWVLAVIALVSALMVVAGKLYGDRLMRSSLSASPDPIEIVIGNDVLEVPQNMFRHAGQRAPGVAERVDIKVHWPERSGYRLELADAFSDTDPETTQTVLISVARRQWLLDMAGRLDLVYAKAVAPGSGPRQVHGLTALRLDPAHGYVDETLYYAPSSGSLLPFFIARCNEPGAGGTMLMLACETDLFFGETLEARIRFPAHFLDDWAVFKPELDAFLEDMLVSAR